MSQNSKNMVKIAREFACLCQVESLVHFYSGNPSVSGSFSFCQLCRHPRCIPQNTFEYGIREAFRWQGRYIYYCPAGLTFVAACTAQKGELAAGITMGPFLMGDCLDALESITPADTSFRAIRLPDFSPAQVDALSHLLHDAICMEVIDSNIPRSFSQYPSSLRNAQDADITFKIKEFIQKNYSSHLTLDDIAGVVYLSRSYASSLFKEQTGCGIFEYLNAVRIDSACALLRDTDLSLAEIAQQCGFEDQSYFTRVFKKAMRRSPLQYRKSPTPEEKKQHSEYMP